MPQIETDDTMGNNSLRHDSPFPAAMGSFPTQPREQRPQCNHALSPERLFKVYSNAMDLLLLKELREGSYDW